MSKYNSLKIGEWNISIDDFITDKGKLYWPVYIGAFYDFSNRKEADFYVNVKLNKEVEEPKGNLIDTFSEGFYPYNIYKMKSGEYKWFLKDNQLNNKIVYSISSDWKNWSILLDKSDTCGLESFRYLGNIFAYSVLNYGGIVFHGVLMEYNGKGVIVSADSGVGKTTHTRMWRDSKNALILNGDRSLCRKINNKWYGFGSPWFGSSGEYINRKVPIDAIVLLERGKTNQIYKLNPVESTLGLIERSFSPKWDRELMEKTLNYIDDIINEVPVYKLKCTPDIEAVEVLKKEIDKL